MKVDDEPESKKRKLVKQNTFDLIFQEIQFNINKRTVTMDGNVDNAHSEISLML